MRILLTGGSANGKSTYAEALMCALPGPRYYIATMRPYGEESERKIARHRELRREKGFLTIEKYTDVGEIIMPERGAALLECICNLTANEMFPETGGVLPAYEKVMAGVEALSAMCRDIVVVTNDVGGGSAGAYSEETLQYVETLGRINAALAASFDEVYELVAGIPLLLKGGAK